MQTSHLTHTDLASPFSFPQPLPQRQLGNNGPVIAALGLGYGHERVLRQQR
jgi:hypothetical protein